MSTTVKFLPLENAVVIDERKYTLEQLKKSNKKLFKKIAAALETSIENTLNIIKNQPTLFDKSELEELVASDVAKGDYHSTPLIQ